RAGRVRLCAELDGAPVYLRVSAGTRAFDALFAACDLETPDADDKRDIDVQSRALVGCMVVVETDTAGMVRRILAPLGSCEAAE
ncbi:MAG TPA: hypothetical protein VK524_19640, partial [Polyangiaceae bacterium]|nr:hypothetical protein [Polyangiaceae bacterium]